MTYSKCHQISFFSRLFSKFIYIYIITSVPILISPPNSFITNNHKSNKKAKNFYSFQSYHSLLGHLNYWWVSCATASFSPTALPSYAKWTFFLDSLTLINSWISAWFAQETSSITNQADCQADLATDLLSWLTEV